MKKKKLKITKEQILCVAAGCLLSVCMLLFGGETHLSTDESGNSFIKRPEAGSTEKEIEVIASYGDEKEALTVGISPRKRTEEELEALFLMAMNRLPEILRGENESLLQIRSPLSFPGTLPDCPGLSISYRSSDRSVVTEEGTVQNEELTESVTLEITVCLRADEISREFFLPVRVFPPGESTESDHDRLLRLVEESDQKDPETEKVSLPGEVNGKRVTYRTKPGPAPVFLFFLGIFSAFLLSLKPKEEEKERKKKRETELLIDYSEVVSKLIVYIGAGLTIRNAWSKMAEGAGEDGREVMKEIVTTDHELKNGIPESKAYMTFGKRCGLKCYIRLSSLLDQNRRTGDSALLSALELEMEEAFEQRKNTAKRLGEEAGTKLMLPLMMSLVTVLIIVLVPAVLKMM